MSAGPRFYVQEFTGWLIPINPGDPCNPKTSFYVMDSEHLHKVVATFENRPGRVYQQLKVLRRRAERECALRNEWDREEVSRGLVG